MLLYQYIAPVLLDLSYLLLLFSGYIIKLLIMYMFEISYLFFLLLQGTTGTGGGNIRIQTLTILS